MTPAEKQAHRAKVSGGDGLLAPGEEVEVVVADELDQETDAASTDADESEETETDDESTGSESE